jgi:predicted transcriptional regulator
MSDSNEKVVLTENDNVSQQKEIRLVDVVVSDENVALNLMVSFLSLAHKRGSFGLDESAKIWECVQMFQK